MSIVLRLVSPHRLFAPLTSDLKVIQRGIKGNLLRCSSPPVQKPAPYPYRTKRYTRLNSLFDKTSARMDDNSKLIVVEGPVASGKSKFAKELAADLDFYHLPEANLDMLYTNDYGYNFKKSDPELPASVRSFDVGDFLLNPKSSAAARFQFLQYRVRYSQYLDALAHLFSTGQGVVLERTPFSDFVFLEAMYNNGYISKEARSIYYELRRNTIFQLVRPHLVVYLDVSVESVLEKIKRRNFTAETEGKVLNAKYLRDMEDSYKQNYLKEISVASELLVYDWTEEGEMEVVIEDIERLEFKRQDIHDPKFADWVFEFEEDWLMARHKFSDEKDHLMDGYFNIPRYDAPELMVGAEVAKEYFEVYHSAPGNMYHYGYNRAMGDSPMFKLGVKHRNTLPLIERQLQ